MSALDVERVICRCEEITLGEIRKAIKEGARDVDAVKRVELSKLKPFTVRPPVRPVPVKCWRRE